MQKYAKYILILVVLVGIFSATTQINAQNYQLLEPLPCTTAVGGADCVINESGNREFGNFDPSPDTALGRYLNIMIRLVIGLSAVMAVVMMVIGGIEYMTSELISSKEAGKERIRGALLGLLLALGAYALLFTINPNLLSTDFEIPTATVYVGLDTPQQPENGRYFWGNTPYIAGDTWTGAITTLPNGVILNRTGDCVAIGQQNCTSLRGLQLDYINNIMDNCGGCVLTVTGGTEFWLHKRTTSHGSGSPTVDLDDTPSLNNYVLQGETPELGKEYIRGGIPFIYEGNHWHVGE